MSNTITPNLGLKKPSYHDNRWDKPVNENWDILDATINKCGGGVTPLTSTPTIDVVEDRQNDLVVVADDDKIQVFDTSVNPSVVIKSFDSLSHVKSVAMEKKVLVWIDDNGFAGHDLNTDTALTAAIGILAGANNIDIATLTSNDQCIAIATDNGLSVVIGASLSSINIIATTSSYSKIKSAKIIGDRIRVVHVAGTLTSDICVVFKIPTSDESSEYYNKSLPSYVTRLTTTSKPRKWNSNCNSHLFFSSSVSNSVGLTLISENVGNYEKSLVCFIDNEFISGWMMGETVGSWLCNDVTVDRHKSGTATALTKHGSLSLSPVLSGSELKAVSGFSTANYLEKDNAKFSDTLYAYCWVKGATGWKFKHGVVSSSPIDGLSITGTVLKIAGTYPKALLRLTKDTPTTAQLAKIEADEQPLFQGAQCLIQGTDKNVKSLFEDGGTVYAGTSEGVTSFSDLTAKFVYIGDTTAIGGFGVFGGSGGTIYHKHKEDICLVLENLKLENSALNNKIITLEEENKPCNGFMAGTTSSFPDPWVDGTESPFQNLPVGADHGVTVDKTAGSFTILKDGTYKIDVTCLYTYGVATSKGYIYLDVIKNGTMIFNSPYRIIDGFVANTTFLSTMMDLVTGDVISFQSRITLFSLNKARSTPVSFSIFKV